MGISFCVIMKKIEICGKNNVFFVCQVKSVTYSVSEGDTAAAAVGCRVDLV